MTNFSWSDIASNGGTEVPRPKDPKISFQRVSRSNRPHQTVDSLVQRHRLLRLKRAEWHRRTSGFRQKHTPWAGTGAWAGCVTIFLDPKMGAIMHLCQVGAHHVWGPSAQAFHLGATVSSAVHEGGVGRQEAIGRSTHPRPCAEPNWKTAEATSRPAGRVSRRYNWLSVRSNDCMQQGGRTKNGRVMQ